MCLVPCFLLIKHRINFPQSRTSLDDQDLMTGRDPRHLGSRGNNCLFQAALVILFLVLSNLNLVYLYNNTF